MRGATVVALAMLACVPVYTVAQEGPPRTTPDQSGEAKPTTIGGKWYVNFRIGRSGDENYSRFGLDRGYLIVKHQLTTRLSGRITPDISMDREGDGEGDLEMRLKYCYLDYSLDDLWIFTDPHVEFGLVHRPWLDYEEHVNYYRVQGTMFLERNDIFNSGDYGFTVFSLIGGGMGKDYLESVNDKYPGRYGSIAFGLYNGGGYHAIENNSNKTFEGRLTLRPLPDVVPGLQFSYHGVVGAGNNVGATDWNVNLLFASWESEHLVLTGQHYRGVGNFKATAVDANEEALAQQGFSVFGEWRIAPRQFSLIGRYDSFDATPSSDSGGGSRFIAGAAYHFNDHSMLLLDYDVGDDREMGGDTHKLLKFSVEFSF